VIGLIKAEFRKTTTTNLWWGLLIPTVLLAAGWAAVTGALGNAFTDAITEGTTAQVVSALGVDGERLQVALFGMARSINVATIFPMIFGGLAVSNEISRRTITTTFLTAPTRGSALTAKLVVYLTWGAIFGVAIGAAVSLGTVLTANPGLLPGPGGWLALCGVGVLLSILMTMLGVGVGALLGNVVATTTVLIFYMLVIENGIALLLAVREVPGIIGFLPNGSADGITGSVASAVFLAAAGPVPDEIVEGARVLSGAMGAFDWWLSALIFLGWVAVFFGGSWALLQRRDIT
jgi:ABC-2 type transport system permease protein